MNFRDLGARSIVNITSNSDKYSDLSNETNKVRNVRAETHMSLCEYKIWFARSQESKHDL